MKKLLSSGIQALAALVFVGASSGFAEAQTWPPGATGRTEIVTYDNWTVTCRDARDAREKRTCTAELSIVQDANNTRRVLLAWVISLNKDGVPTSTLRFLSGIQTGPGVEMKFSEKVLRRFAVTICEPTHCEATIRLDDAFVRNASAVAQVETIIQTSDGRLAAFTINMKGFAPALAAVRR